MAPAGFLNGFVAQQHKAKATEPANSTPRQVRSAGRSESPVPRLVRLANRPETFNPQETPAANRPETCHPHVSRPATPPGGIFGCEWNGLRGQKECRIRMGMRPRTLRPDVQPMPLPPRPGRSLSNLFVGASPPRKAARGLERPPPASHLSVAPLSAALRPCPHGRTPGAGESLPWL